MEEIKKENRKKGGYKSYIKLLIFAGLMVLAIFSFWWLWIVIILWILWMLARKFKK